VALEPARIAERLRRWVDAAPLPGTLDPATRAHCRRKLEALCDPALLSRKVELELGGRAWEPVGRVLVVVSENDVLGTVAGFLAAVLTGNRARLKARHTRPLLDGLKRAFELDDHACEILDWSGAGQDDAAVLDGIDAVLLAGGGDLVRRYRAAAAPGVRLVEFGPKVSCAAVWDAPARDRERADLADALAADVALFSQRVCSSPQFVLLEDADAARELRSELRARLAGLPPLPEDDRAIQVVLSLDDPSHRWSGYLGLDELPGRLDPPGDWMAYANQLSTELFRDGRAISNRWHPPTRARRIAELLGRRPRHDPASLAGIQDDRVDLFARGNLPFLLARLGRPTALDGWSGDTRETERALLFERWMIALADELLATTLPPELAGRYVDLWPAHRWNVVEILRRSSRAWGIDDVDALVRRAFERALAAAPERPAVEFRHTLRRHPLARALFSVRHAFDGGSRETVHVARRNTDFLTASQGEARSGARPAAAFAFGPALKIVFDLSPDGAIHYLANMPASGNPLALHLAPTLRRWREGRRYVTRLDPLEACAPAEPLAAPRDDGRRTA
jgi:hypothetical protein